MRHYHSPMPMGSHVTRPMSDDLVFEGDRLTKYQSGAGSLLYLTKHTRPDLSNCVRELTKVMDGAPEGHYIQLLWVIKFEQGPIQKL